MTVGHCVHSARRGRVASLSLHTSDSRIDRKWRLIEETEALLEALLARTLLTQRM